MFSLATECSQLMLHFRSDLIGSFLQQSWQNGAKALLNSTQTPTQYKHAYVLDSSHSHNDSKIYDFFLYAQKPWNKIVSGNTLFPFGIDIN